MFRSLSIRQKFKFSVIALLIAPVAGHAACTGENAAEALRQSDPVAFATIAAAADQTTNGEGVFWRIDAPGVPPSFLFGTKHTVENGTTPGIAEVQSVIRDARLLMVELSPAEQAEMTSAMRTDPAMIIDMTGGTIEDFLPQTLIPRAADVLVQYGLPYEAAKRMHPWFLQMIMALPPCAVAAQQTNPGQIMDNMLAQSATEAGVSVEGLETWEDQISIFRNVSDHDARNGLIYAIQNFQDKDDEFRAMSDLYDTREIAMLWEFSRWALMNSDYDFETTAEHMFADLEQALLNNRNKMMFAHAKDEVADGGVVIAVGALHLIGDTGLVAAFQHEGYQVTRLD